MYSRDLFAWIACFLFFYPFKYYLEIVSTGWLSETDGKSEKFSILSERCRCGIKWKTPARDNIATKRVHKYFIKKTKTPLAQQYCRSYADLFFKKWLHLHSIWHWYHRKCLLYISGGNQTCTKQSCLCSSTMWQCNKIYLNGSVTWYFKIYEGTLGSSNFPFFFPSFIPMQSREANNPALGYQLPLLRAWSEQRARYSCAEF